MRMHFERAAQAAARHAKLRRAAQQDRAGNDLSRRVALHPSWAAHRSLGVNKDPIDLADEALLVGTGG
jgi:hypothetical protein